MSIKTNKEKLITSPEAKALGWKRISEDELPSAVRKHRQVLKRREKQRISINLDSDIIEYFKKASGGSGYQTMINDALRELISSGNKDIAISLLENPAFIDGLKEKLGV